MWDGNIKKGVVWSVGEWLESAKSPNLNFDYIVSITEKYHIVLYFEDNHTMCNVNRRERLGLVLYKKTYIYTMSYGIQCF